MIRFNCMQHTAQRQNIKNTFYRGAVSFQHTKYYHSHANDVVSIQADSLLFERRNSANIKTNLKLTVITYSIDGTFYKKIIKIESAVSYLFFKNM